MWNMGGGGGGIHRKESIIKVATCYFISRRKIENEEKVKKIVGKSGTLFQTIPDLAYNYILFVLHTYCIVVLRL